MEHTSEPDTTLVPVGIKDPGHIGVGRGGDAVGVPDTSKSIFANFIAFSRPYIGISVRVSVSPYVKVSTTPKY